MNNNRISLLIFSLFTIVFSFNSCKKTDDNTAKPTGTFPVIETSSVFNVKINSASCGGNISSDGGSDIIAKGVCWSKNPIPTLNDNKNDEGKGFSSFRSFIPNLNANTTYYVRAYATNSFGTSYGDTILKFKTLYAQSNFNKNVTYDTITDIEGNEYKTVIIGAQEWMAQNLRTTKYNNGDVIASSNPHTLDVSEEDAPKYQWPCYNDESNDTIYGRLYTWHTITDSRGICPTGWRIPTDIDWLILTDLLQSFNSGPNLKETGTTHWSTPNSATNETGFTALPAGERDKYGNFSDFGNVALWWSSTESDSSYAYFLEINYNNSYSRYFKGDKKTGLSVRCIRDIQ